MWKIWAVLEGFSKTINAILQKLVGVTMGTVEMGCIAAIIIGSIQSASGFVGFIVMRLRNPEKAPELIPDARSILWAILFGFFAGIFGTVLSIYTFTLGAELGVRTLLITASIIPGAIAGRLIWGDALGFRHWVGIGVFLTSMWAMLDFPNAAMLLSLPAWMWLVLGVSFANAINEMLSRASSVKLNSWTNNFWVGMSTVFFAAIGFVAITAFSDGIIVDASRSFALGALATAFVVAGMISFKLLAFQGGGTIVLKTVIMPGTYLITAAIVGVMFYGESFTLGKCVGIALWPVAIMLVDNKVWKLLSTRFFPERESSK